MALRPLRPIALNPAPSMVVLMLGGLTGSLLMLSIAYAGPLAGLPPLDLLRGLGALFAADSGGALAVGACLLLLTAVPLFPLIAMLSWSVLPGRADTIAGALLNGAALGGACWITLGLVLGIASSFGRLPAPDMPGWLGFAAGFQGAIVFAVAALSYGLAIGLVGFVEQGISPLDAVGWRGFSQAATGPLELDAHRSAKPERPAPGEQPWRRRT